MKDWDYPLRDLAHYCRKILTIYVRRALFWLNRRLLPTYSLIEDYARCDDCGRNVHDFDTSDELWRKVSGHEDGSGILCYDCFCDRADRKGIRNFWATISAA